MEGAPPRDVAAGGRKETDLIKTLDARLADIHANPSSSKAFILADAKDADMAFGIAAPGKSPEHVDGGYRTLQEYRDHIRENVRQGLVDIMLMSVSTSEALTLSERLFDGSAVTPAIRANDTSDIFAARGGAITREAAVPFRTALLDHAQCGKLGGQESERGQGADLGLYSVTFNNDARLDTETLEAYKQFRMEAELKRFRHFLEVFDPNAATRPIAPELLGHFVNDMVVRSLAGVAAAGRPIFLKMVYHGPKFMEELAHYDPHLVPGVLGGSAGTTHDAFHLLAEARKYGARAALFGRKINSAEHQLSFIQFLRWLADGEIEAAEAVRAYHGVLERLGLRPRRSLAKDMELTGGRSSYGGTASHGGTGSVVTVPRAAAIQSPPQVRPAPGQVRQASRLSESPPATPPRPAATPPAPAREKPKAASTPAKKPPPPAEPLPNFQKMTPQERLDYHRKRIDRMFGEGKKG
jgi:hypothetical protein